MLPCLMVEQVSVCAKECVCLWFLATLRSDAALCYPFTLLLPCVSFSPSPCSRCQLCRVGRHAGRSWRQCDQDRPMGSHPPGCRRDEAFQPRSRGTATPWRTESPSCCCCAARRLVHQPPTQLEGTQRPTSGGGSTQGRECVEEGNVPGSQHGGTSPRKAAA